MNSCQNKTGREFRTRDAVLIDVDVALLAGGLGTRVRDALGDLPKVLAPLGDETLLDSQVHWLAGWGARRIVLCLGIRHQAVVDHLDRKERGAATLVPSIEPRPLGTAGAIALARDHFEHDTVLVMNGDTMLEGELGGFADAHRQAGAACTILCVSVEDAARYGGVLADVDGAVTGFEEKGREGPGMVSAGAYLMTRSFLDEWIKPGEASLEREVFPRALNGSIRAYLGDFRFLDIGTPESLARARLGRGNFVAGQRQV
jgi:NDP-sugar pyrophosphorylase family protein